MKQSLLNSLLFLVLILIGQQQVSAQTLSAGDIAFIGYDTDSNDGFTFIALAPIPGGEVIYFTDKGWNGTTSSWFNTAEDNLEWTAPAAGIACGGIINVTEIGGDIFSTSSGVVVLSLGSVNWSMSAGDQIIAYQSGSGVFPASPTFITAIHGDYNSSAYDPATTWSDVNSTTATAQSSIPPGLTNGVNCISLFPAPGPELDNNKYTGSLVGTAADVRAMIHNPANWFGTNDISLGRLPIMPNNFSASITCPPPPCTSPTIPTVTFSPATVCSGSNATLSILGTLNDATAWKVYAGSCGGTLVGTTTGTTISVSPASGGTTYYVRGEGGCVTPSSCGSVIVTVTSLDDASFSYSAASYCVDGSDPTPTITGLAGGVFSSGAGLSINASTGTIDVSASTSGSYTIAYTTSGSCPNSSNTSITINSLEDASFSYNTASYCVDGSDPTPTITGLAGGVFSSGAGLSINASTGTIDVSASTSGSYTVTYTTSGSCPNSSNTSVTINSLDAASFGYSTASYCVDGSDPTPTITGLAGGVFSSGAGLSINASTGTIDVSASTSGSYTIAYTTSGSCPNSSNTSITINSLEDASFSYNTASYCVDGSDPTPTITGLAGGVFSSGAGLSINASTGTIDVSASTSGSYTVTYTTSGSCPNNSNTSITINSLDDASFGYSIASYCVDGSDPTPTITGLAGGVFSSGAGLSINASTGTIDVSASTSGSYTIAYTTSGSCPNSSNTSITITNLEDASFGYSTASYCVNGSDPTPTVTGLSGGVFSSGAGLSINASTGTIDVSASTSGSYTITYTTSGSCPNNSNTSITINSLDAASFSYSTASYCVNGSDPTPTITGLAGGVFSSGTGLSINASTGTIDVSASASGSYTITYTTSGSCPNNSNTSITINSLEDASFGYSIASYCVNGSDPTPTITGLAGGVFSSGAGLSINALTGTIDVSASTSGSYTITYTTLGSCPNSSNTSITITNFDDASFSYSTASYCVNGSDPTPTITGLAGGVFSSVAGLSINASTGTIDVSASTSGSYTITYTTSGSCPNSSNTSVTITNLEDASFSYSTASYCVNGSDPTPTITGLAGGVFTFSPTGLSISATGVIDLSASIENTYTVTYSTTGSCSSSSNVLVVIGDVMPPVLDVVTLPNITADCEVASLTDPVVTDNCSTSVIISNNATFPITAEGITIVTWTFDDGNGNSISVTQNVIIDDVTAPVIPTLADITGECSATAVISPTTIDACSGTITGTTTDALSYNNQGTHIIVWTFDDGNGNSIDVDQNVIVNDVTDPIAIAQDITVVLDVNGKASIQADAINDKSTDNCMIASITIDIDTFDCFKLGDYPVVLTVTDLVGNTAQATAIVTVTGKDTDNNSIADSCDKKDDNGGAFENRYGFSPNGDGINDTWTIKGIKSYPKAKVFVFNRSGKKVFEAVNYQNTWGGYDTFSNSSNKLPVGAYYFAITFNKDNLPPKNGWIYINY